MVQFPSLNRITLGRHKSDNNNQMIKLPTCFVYCLYKIVPAVFDYNKRQILLTVMQLSDGYYITWSTVLTRKNTFNFFCIFPNKMHKSNISVIAFFVSISWIFYQDSLVTTIASYMIACHSLGQGFSTSIQGCREVIQRVSISIQFSCH